MSSSPRPTTSVSVSAQVSNTKSEVRVAHRSRPLSGADLHPQVSSAPDGGGHAVVAKANATLDWRHHPQDTYSLVGLMDDAIDEDDAPQHQGQGVGHDNDHEAVTAIHEDSDISVIHIDSEHQQQLQAQHQPQLYRYRFAKPNTTNPDHHLIDEDEEDQEEANTRRHVSRRSTRTRHQQVRSISPSTIMLNRILSVLSRPFSRAKRKRRQLLPISLASGHTSKHHQHPESAQSRLLGGSSDSGSHEHHNHQASGGLRLMLWRARLPLALFCFVFLFVLQFRANSHYTSSSAMVVAPLPLQPQSQPLTASLSEFVNKSSSSSLLFSPTAAQITVHSNISIADVRSNEISPLVVPSPTSLFLNPIDYFISANNSDDDSNTLSNLMRMHNISENEINSTLPACPLVPPKLVGRLKVLRDPPPMAEMEAELGGLHVGGRYAPDDCRPKWKVAIIVPYRDREDHLRTFLWNIHPMLMRQNIDYGIYIVEQVGHDRFNRAKLMNIGFLEALKQHNYDCFIFHDVDLIPEDDRNLYTCPEQPRHMSVAIDKFRYRLPYQDLFGGVSSLTKSQFETVNGFSNEFWGWGGEDDDMSNRVRHYKFKISRYAPEIARYTMLKHNQDAPNTDRYKKLYSGWRRFKSDGINSTKYQVVDLSFKKLYTWVLVDVFPPTLAKHSARRHLPSTTGVRSSLFPRKTYGKAGFSSYYQRHHF